MTKTSSNSTENNLPHLEKENQSPIFENMIEPLSTTMCSQMPKQMMKKVNKPRKKERLIHSLSKSPIDTDVSMFSQHSSVENEQQDAQPPSDTKMQTESPCSQCTIPPFSPSPPKNPPHLIRKSN